jgi:hypothetical protein
MPPRASPSSESSPRVRWLAAAAWARRGRPSVRAGLARAAAVGLRAAWPPSRCAALVRGVRRARAAWTADFGGEQFALGRAFYTHLETDRAREYFADAVASDARVEAALPGMQAETRALLGAMLGAAVVRTRPGFCGPGVHVFPAAEKVARAGGVVHFDTEGLTPFHLTRRAPAVTLVVMLQSPARGGGLRLWDVEYTGRDEPTDGELATPSCRARYGVGDALLIESYRLHQIQPFGGARDRISVTVHAVEVDPGVWEVWF